MLDYHTVGLFTVSSKGTKVKTCFLWFILSYSHTQTTPRYLANHTAIPSTQHKLHRFPPQKEQVFEGDWEIDSHHIFKI